MKTMNTLNPTLKTLQGRPRQRGSRSRGTVPGIPDVGANPQLARGEVEFPQEHRSVVVVKVLDGPWHEHPPPEP